MMSDIYVLNKPAGFSPEKYIEDYANVATGEVRKRLPVLVKIAWFRDIYPEGRIETSVTGKGDYFVARARVYAHYDLPADRFLAEATASRAYNPAAPGVSPREWAQTAAIGAALRNAGIGVILGLPDEAMEASVEAEAVREEADMPERTADKPDSVPEEPDTENVAEADAPAVAAKAPERKETPEEKFARALTIPCPIRKYEGQTLGSVMETDYRAVKWIAEKYDGEKKAAREAARYIIEYMNTRNA